MYVARCKCKFIRVSMCLCRDLYLYVLVSTCTPTTALLYFLTAQTNKSVFDSDLLSCLSPPRCAEQNVQIHDKCRINIKPSDKNSAKKTLSRISTILVDKHRKWTMSHYIIYQCRELLLQLLSNKQHTEKCWKIQSTFTTTYNIQSIEMR